MMDNTIEELAQALNSDRRRMDVIAFPKYFVDICGSTTSALLLAQLRYWYYTQSEYCKSNNIPWDGWVYKTVDDWFEETRLSKDQQRTARKRLAKLGYIEEKLIGIPAKPHFRFISEVVNLRVAEFILTGKVSSNPRMLGKSTATLKRGNSSVLDARKDRIPRSPNSTDAKVTGQSGQLSVGESGEHNKYIDYTETTTENTRKEKDSPKSPHEEEILSSPSSTPTSGILPQKGFDNSKGRQGKKLKTEPEPGEKTFLTDDLKNYEGKTITETQKEFERLQDDTTVPELRETPQEAGKPTQNPRSTPETTQTTPKERSSISNRLNSPLRAMDKKPIRVTEKKTYQKPDPHADDLSKIPGGIIIKRIMYRFPDFKWNPGDGKKLHEWMNSYPGQHEYDWFEFAASKYEEFPRDNPCLDDLIRLANKSYRTWWLEGRAQ